MAVSSKVILSGSTDGKAIKVAATATPGTTIHTGSSSPGVAHEIWLYAMNTDTADRKLTIEWGASASPDDLIEITVPAESGLRVISPGLLIQGNASPLVVRAFAAAANVITIHGFYRSIT